jgi:hopanoid-associated phosphorylase
VSAAASTRAVIVAVTGLAKEARIATGSGVRAIAGGGDIRGLADALEAELARGARGVISFGIAGGLADDFAPGASLVARAVIAQDVCWRCDVDWARAVAQRVPEATMVDLAGTDAPVMHASAKRALQRATGAAAVDTESHIAAAIAARYRLPFAAFRVVADSAWRALPPVASVALARDGTIRRGAVLRSMAGNPAQIPSMVRAAADARRAFRALLRSRRLLGFGLACPDFSDLLLDVS